MKTLFPTIPVALLLMASSLRAANPLVTTGYTSDPAARVFHDRVYVYTSHEEPTSKSFADMHTWHLLSSGDMTTWKDHGEIFSLAGFPWAKQFAWAPDSLEHDGKIFLFLPVDRTKIGVAVGDHPEGPFTDAIGKPLIDNTTMKNAGPEPIDPALLHDDDGTTYLYFGCRFAKVVKLDPSLTKLAGEIQDLPLLDPAGKPLPVAAVGKQPALPMGYAEAPYIFKRNGTYYFVYSNGWADQSTLVYATGTSPTGPFTYAGPVMNRTNCSTQHGSVLQFHGKWYLFYHDTGLSGGNSNRRSVCCDELTFTEDGKIIPVTPTSTGPQPIIK